jgi:glucosyl-3-phosphoglycerate synthase
VTTPRLPSPGTPFFHHRDFAVEALVEVKSDTLVSVCLPARDEVATIGQIVGVLDGLRQRGLVDEVLVIDDGSSDGTAERARQAGAEVIAAADVLPEHGTSAGKGDALWKSAFASTGDIVAWCDADIRDFDARFVVGLVGPLLTRPDVSFTKGFYDRPFEGSPGQGGRVTELVARPLLSLLHPQLAGIVQPLAGEYAGRRELLERLPFVRGYGVDLGLLVDIAAHAGIDAIGQVDLGERVHRNRPLQELSPQAAAIIRTALERAGVEWRPEWSEVLVRPGLDPLVLPFDELPPLVEVAAYRRDIA